jgi:hypothetical protein
VAEMDAEQFIDTDAAIKIVNILTSKYAQVSVEQNQFRTLIENLIKGTVIAP